MPGQIVREAVSLIRRSKIVIRNSFSTTWNVQRLEIANQHHDSFAATPRRSYIYASFRCYSGLSVADTVLGRSFSSLEEEYDHDRYYDSRIIGEDHDAEISNDGQEITITTTTNLDNDDDIKYTFSAPLLWVNDPQYIHPSSGQRIRTLGQYTNQTAVMNATIMHVDNDDNNNNLHPPPLPGSLHPRGGIYSHSSKATTNSQTESAARTIVEIEWNNGEHSHFDLSWLVEHALVERLGQTSTAFAEMFKQASRQYQHDQQTLHKMIQSNSLSSATRVTKDIAIKARENDQDLSIPILEYEHVLDNEDSLFEAMQGIYEYGAILIRNAPTPSRKEQESIVGNLGKKFSGGSLSHGSLYGDVFHVQSKAGAENIAYTNVGLPPHQDLTYYESKPFLQLLHCVNNGNGQDSQIIGGESVLIDAMAAAEELRLRMPDVFDTLCQTEATFIKEREGADMVSPKPHIVTDPAYGHVVEVNWSPPFEGPFQLQPRVSIDSYVAAYQALELMLNDQAGMGKYESLLDGDLEDWQRDYASEYTWEYALEPGDVLVFNNQRMLHGRREFTAAGNAERHLIGCYTDAMDTTSRYRQLLRERGGTSGGGYGKRNPGSGCRWI